MLLDGVPRREVAEAFGVSVSAVHYHSLRTVGYVARHQEVLTPSQPDGRRAGLPISPGQEWMLRGRCVDRDPEVFFPSSESAAAARPAKRVCGPCPVIDECREFALSTRQDFGVWGGLAGAERLTALRERTAS